MTEIGVDLHHLDVAQIGAAVSRCSFADCPRDGVTPALGEIYCPKHGPIALRMAALVKHGHKARTAERGSPIQDLRAAGQLPERQTKPGRKRVVPDINPNQTTLIGDGT